MRWSIIGISETRWTGAGEAYKGEYKIIYSGRTDNKHQKGVELIIKPEAARAMIGYVAVGPRIIKARVRAAILWKR